MLVSVIIPTYNRADAVLAAIESVVEQTYKPVEIIVVDDGSTDGTAGKLEKCGAPLLLLRQPNAGPSAARNKGIAAARGDVLSFLDSDDLWLPDKLAMQMDVLRSGGDGMPCCITNALLKGDHNENATSFQVAQIDASLPSGMLLNPAEILASRFVLFNQVVAVRRAALSAVGCFDAKLRLLEDYDLALRLSHAGPWGVVTVPLVVKNHQTDSLTESARHAPLSELRALGAVLQKFLSANKRVGDPSFALARKMQRRVRGLIVAESLVGSEISTVAFSGRVLRRMLQVEMGIQRRLSSWPRACIAPVSSVRVEHVSTVENGGMIRLGSGDASYAGDITSFRQ